MKDIFLWLNKTFAGIKKISTYPIAVFSVAIMVVVYLTAKVVPTFADVFAGFGVKLPGPTLFVINVCKHPWIIFLILLLFWELAFLKWKGIIKLGWLKEWMIIMVLGLLLGFITLAMFMPMFELGI